MGVDGGISLTPVNLGRRQLQRDETGLQDEYNKLKEKMESKEADQDKELARIMRLFQTQLDEARVGGTQTAEENAQTIASLSAVRTVILNRFKCTHSILGSGGREAGAQKGGRR